MTDNEKRRDAVDGIAEHAAETMLGPNPFVGMRHDDILKSLADLWVAMLRDPMSALDQQARIVRETLFPPEKATQAPAGDKRFSDAVWKDNPFYAALMRHYLAWSNALVATADQVDVNDITRERARFSLSLIADALAPTNTLMGNPVALKKTIESHGANLAAGFSNFLKDLSENGGMPAQVDKTAFEVGRNLAVSPGSVVFRNEVLELIQYQPKTPQVHARPHLFIPPQINKFYVFDLAPGKSIVQFLVEQGFHVFMVSWRNPTAANRDWDVATYVAALQEAIRVVRDITGADDIIPHAACSGAMTSVMLAAVMAAQDNSPIVAMTLMVAVLGNESDSQLGMFATDDVIAVAKQEVAAKGVLEGKEMGRVFAWMRPNDLVWNYWVNNYLLGNAPPRFDVLYWNNDTTRLPAKFHAALLDILGKSLLLKPGEVKVNGVPVDIGKIKADKFIVAGTTDHITPWRGVYRMAQSLGGNNEFILSSSGHIQSLVNPPGNPKSKFSVNPSIEATADEWLSKATVMQGSWWDRWAEWLRERSGDLVPAPASPGNDQYKPLAAAPGTYVHDV